MKIQAIVEGHGEVAAVPVLIRRLLVLAEVYDIEVHPPIRKTRSDLAVEARFRLAIRLALANPRCGAILIILDGDDDCPKEMGPKLQGWAESETDRCPCAVVIANREFEAWLLASIDSLRGCRGIDQDATSHPEPESPRNAKGQLTERMAGSRSYSETVDQAALTAVFDLPTAFRSCRSFRRLVGAFGRLLAGLGREPKEWPPASWSRPSP